jgi:hypothetical protein
VVVRRGISLLLILLLALPCGAANNFASDGNCKALFRLESGALTTDSKGTNTLTDSGGSADAVNYKEGSASYLTSSVNDQLYCADADLDAGFPLKNGDSNKKISVCVWVRCAGFPASDPRHIVHKGGNGTRSFLIGIDCAASPDNQPTLWIGYDSGNSYEEINFGTSMVANQWYHFGVTYQDSDKSYKIRIWDDTAGALLGGAEVTGTTTNNINVENAMWAIGSDTYFNDSMGGQRDEVVVFDDILSSAEIDQIRAGTYGAAATTTILHPVGSGIGEGIGGGL